MTKFRKSVVALISAICLVAAVAVGFALQPKPSTRTFADEAIVSTDGDSFSYSDDAHTVITGFDAGYSVSAKLNLAIPEGVTEIAANAFDARAEIIGVELPATLRTIGENAFRNCTGLVEIYNKSNIVLGGTTSTDNGAIAYSALNIYTAEGGSRLDTTTHSGFIFCTDTRTEGEEKDYLVGRFGEAAQIELPAGNYDIRQYAFWNDKALTRVTSAAGANISAVGNFAFFGCENLRTVGLPATVTALGASAFQGCERLTDLNFNDFTALKTIDASAFSGCIALAGLIEFPATLTTIGIEAFYNCARLTQIGFAAGAEKLEVRRAAFRGCNALAVADFRPRSITLYSQAFDGCANLSTAYFKTVSFSKIDDNSTFFGANTTIIYESSAACAAAKTDAAGNADQMTYLVTVSYNEVGRATEPQKIGTAYRLAGRAFNFVEAADKSWGLSSATDANDLFATQEGYSKSVWYTESEGWFAEDKVDAAQMTALLAAETIESDTIELYARYTAAPASVAMNSLSYSETGEGYECDDFLPSDFKRSIYSATLTGANLNQYSKAKNAGEYTVEINLAGNALGKWTNAYQRIVTVTKLTVNPVTLEWQVGGNALNDGTLYVYKNADEDLKYNRNLYVNGIDGYSYDSTLSVTNSIARYTGETVVARLQDGAYTVTYANTENPSAQEGKVKTVATVTLANPNYQFPEVDTVENAARGIAAKKNADGSMEITKVWYIINSGNGLYLDLPHGDFLGTPYSIGNWTYMNAQPTISFPLLEKDGENQRKVITFQLIKDESAIIGENSEIPLTDFDQYVNGSMPVGHYKISFNVPAFTDKDTGETYAQYTETYEFTVSPAEFKETWEFALKSRLKNREDRYQANTVQLYEYSDISSIWTTGALNPSLTGIWATPKYAEYYSQRFELKYNIEGMASNRYYSVAELASDGNLLKPLNPGEYTVYYQLEAKNYQSLVDTSDDTARRGYTFTVNVYGVVEVPTLAPLVFNNKPQSPVVPANELYTAANVSQIGCNDYEIELTLNNEHYRWIHGGSVSAQSERTFAVPFSIVRADNAETAQLSIAQWAYGSYSDKTNAPVWSTLYVKDGEADFISFRLVDKADETKSFGLAEFGTAPVGNYTLIATAKGFRDGDSATHSYNWNELVKTLDITITKGTNTWAVTPNVMQWRYGGYDADVNRILAQATIADANNPVKFTVTYDEKGETPVDGLKEFTAANGVVSEEVAAELAKLRAGSYYLTAKVAETDSYSELKPAPLKFSVNRGENYWEKAPSVVTWVQGKYNAEENPINAVSHFAGDLRIVVTAADSGDVVYDSKEGIDRLKTAKVGVYELKATVAGTDDFSELTDTFTFRVFEKAGLPWWAILLIVVGVVGVIALVFFILHQKGVLQLLTGKVIVAMRTKATVDATIAAVRANKLNEDAKQTAHKVRMKELREQRKLKMKEIAELPLEEQAAALDEMAQVTSKKSERLGRRADKIQQKAEAMRKKVAKQSSAEQAEPAAEEPERNPDVTEETPNVEE